MSSEWRVETFCQKRDDETHQLFQIPNSTFEPVNNLKKKTRQESELAFYVAKNYYNFIFQKWYIRSSLSIVSKILNAIFKKAFSFASWTIRAIWTLPDIYCPLKYLRDEKIGCLPFPSSELLCQATEKVLKGLQVRMCSNARFKDY